MAVYSLARDFKLALKDGRAEQFFFATAGVGRPARKEAREYEEQIIALRKQYLSVPDIKVKLDALGMRLSQSYIWQVLHLNGFNRLPRRTARREAGQEGVAVLEAPVSALLDETPRGSPPRAAASSCSSPSCRSTASTRCWRMRSSQARNAFRP